jgi:hypothetical protein
MTGNNWVNNVQKFLKQSSAEIEKKNGKEKLNRINHERECTKSVCRKYGNMYKYCVNIYVICT